MAVWEQNEGTITSPAPPIARLGLIRSAAVFSFRAGLARAYWLRTSYLIVALQTITQITWNSLNHKSRMKSISWHSGGASHERRQWGLLFFVSLSFSGSHAPFIFFFEPLPPSLLLLWNQTAVLILRILLQGLISFPFLERLFKYCYIYSQQQQQQHSLPPFLTCSSSALTDRKLLFILFISPHFYCFLLVSLLFTLHLHCWLRGARNCQVSVLTILHVRIFVSHRLVVSVYMNTGSA